MTIVASPAQLSLPLPEEKPAHPSVQFNEWVKNEGLAPGQPKRALVTAFTREKIEYLSGKFAGLAGKPMFDASAYARTYLIATEKSLKQVSELPALDRAVFASLAELRQRCRAARNAAHDNEVEGAGSGMRQAIRPGAVGRYLD